MKRVRPISLAFAACLAALSACGAPGEPVSADPSDEPLVTAGEEPPTAYPGNSPIVGRLIAPDGVPVAGQSLTLRWEVDQRGDFGVPLDVSVRAPDGVTVSGDVQVHLEAAIGVATGEVRVSFAELPAEDLLIVVHGATEHAGYHQELPYRFGRPEPVIAEPRRMDVPLHIGGRDLGRPVLAEPTGE